MKLREAKITDADLHTIDPQDVVLLEPFCVEFYRVAIRSRRGRPGDLHPGGARGALGDFVRSQPGGRAADRLRPAGELARGVLLLLSDSRTPSRGAIRPRAALGETLARSFAQAQGRVIVATFASNISRLQQVMDIAARMGRRVAVVGRSMVTNVRLARELAT